MKVSHIITSCEKELGVTWHYYPPGTVLQQGTTADKDDKVLIGDIYKSMASWHWLMGQGLYCICLVVVAVAASATEHIIVAIIVNTLLCYDPQSNLF